MRALAAPLLALALAGCGAQSAASDEAFGQKVRAYLLEHPEVLEEAINKLQQTRTAEAAAGAQKLLASNQKALIQDARDPVIGAPNAPITVVEFFDYRCGYCKASAPAVLKIAEENKDVRLVMKEMPILSPESELAARLALQAAKAGKYEAVHLALMAERALDEASIARIARAHGLTPPTTTDAAVTSHLRDVQTLAEQLQITGTPAFIVGEQIIAGADMDALRQAIAAQRKRG